MITITAGTAAANSEALADWLNEHELVPEDTFRIDIDARRDIMRVHQYVKGTARHKKPFDVELKSDLPKEVKNLVGVMEASV